MRILIVLLLGACFMPLTACVHHPSATSKARGNGAPYAARALVGAYYFDGWARDVGPVLRNDYAERKPVWGWRDDSARVMRRQIDYAADYRIDFWAFDWYYPEGPNKKSRLNNALGLYLKARNRDRLQFCLLVANHQKFRIGPGDWDAVCRIWIDLFREPTYLRLDGRPLLIIYSPAELEHAFGGPDGVRKALDALRAKARAAEITEIAVAACPAPYTDLKKLARSGYNLLTGYNYNNGWMNGAGGKPFSALVAASDKIFNWFAQSTPLPYAPVVTTGWDRRPVETGLPPEKQSVWYLDRTPEAMGDFIRLGLRWLDEHPDKATPQRLLMLYAWNENGEGGYLTPTDADGCAYLEAVKRALQ
ncbi:MAG: glycoside hydrolase family 99-like domain-containing protein [bacterium]|nr:glycoside hydrolase family 99-like domain-containing protein [bacterium]